MLAAGATPRWGAEALRILGAGLLGSMTVPGFVSLSRRFPVSFPCFGRNALIHSLCAIATATILITVAHVLASWLLDAGRHGTLADLQDDLAANELLLIAGLLGVSSLAHLALQRSDATSHASAVRSNKAEGHEPIYDSTDCSITATSSTSITMVEFNSRGMTSQVPVGDIDWIETQGNYLAFHVGDSTFLLRETLISFAPRLDPAHFIRIHRRTIIASDRVTRIEPAAKGDAVVRLSDGQALRVSRRYRKALADKISACHTLIEIAGAGDGEAAPSYPPVSAAPI